MRSAAIALLVLQATAAVGENHPHKGVVVSEANGTVTMEIGSADDFPAVWGKYIELVSAPGNHTLDVALRPGEYKMSLQLDDTMKGNVSVRVRSADPAHPAVFDGARLALNGVDLTVEDLVLRNWNRGMTVLDLTVKSSLTVRRCVIVDNHNLDKRGGVLVRFVAGYRSGPKTALIEDCFFARNSETKSKPENMIAFQVMDPDYFQTVRFERTVFLDNRFSCELTPGYPNELRFHDCVIVKKADGVLATLWAPETKLVFDSSTLVLDGWQSLAHVKDSSPPIMIKHSAVYADGAPPSNVKLDGPAHERRDAVALVAHLEKLAAEPRPPLGAELKKALVSQ